MAVYYRQTAHSSGDRAQAGFGATGLVVIVVLMGLLLVPLLRLTVSSLGGAQAQRTQSALETARDALIAYAAQNNGCLPYAADYEGSLPDTDQDGVAQPGYADAGTVRKRENFPTETQDVYSGDLPWADLGLTSDFLDGDRLRIQYYVATPYLKVLQTDPATPLEQKDRICPAGFRGFDWDPTVVYKGTSTEPVFVYYDLDDGIVRALAPPVGPGPLFLTLDGSLVDETGVAVVAKALVVTITSTANDSGVTFDITGTDKKGNSTNEVIAGPSGGGSVVTGKKFLTVTFVEIISGTTAGTIEVGMEGDRQLHWVFYDASLATDPTPGGPDSGGVGIADWYVGYPDAGATTESPVYVFDIHKGVRKLHTIKQPGGDPTEVKKRSELISENLLEVRRGPDVIKGTAAETAVVSLQNVFVLIATGDNINVAANVDGTTTPRAYLRDANHVNKKGNQIKIYDEGKGGEIRSDEVDGLIFSATRNVDPTDEGANGDDTLLVMSFTEFRAEMSKYGMNMEPVCFEKC